MYKRKTTGEKIEEARRLSHTPNMGEDVTNLQRLDMNTRHMVVFDILECGCFVGYKGERMRLFLSETGYQQALEWQSKGEINIRKRIKISRGNVFYEKVKEKKC